MVEHAPHLLPRISVACAVHGIGIRVAIRLDGFVLAVGADSTLGQVHLGTKAHAKGHAIGHAIGQSMGHTIGHPIDIQVML